MSKVIEAQCNALGIVQSEGATITSAKVLTDGKQSSEGILIISGEKAFYLTLSKSDLATTIEKLSILVEKTANIVTSIGGGMTGPTTAPPPTLVSDVAELLALKVELDLLKGTLK